VTAGLSPGDKIVVDGADKLREGAKIVLRQESGAAAPAAAAPASAAPPAAAAAPATPQRPARQGGGRQ
jgi:membrane fusion protein, multidrug efflux system